MDDLSDMTLSRFKLWSLKALKVFLSRRNRSVNGDFEELVARAFTVWEENPAVDIDADVAEQRLLKEYKDKLVVGDDVVPDPYTLSSGWLGEKKGLSYWPSVYISDISDHLRCNNTSTVIMDRLLNEYKEGKAYRYFESGWVREVFFHPIRENSNKCILKCKVTPSMAINSKCYDVWVVVEKDMPDRSGGKVLSAYCTCTAGMFGTCNHVAGLLFRIEHAVKTGETLSKTSKLSTWNVPKGKPVIQAVKAVDLKWTKARYGKVHNETDDVKRTVKKSFTPYRKSQTAQLNKESMSSRLHELLKDDIPNSCFVQLVEKKRSQPVPLNLPPSVVDVASKLKGSDRDTIKDKLLDGIKVNEEQCKDLNSATVNQSASGMWMEQRKGRITASRFHRVVSRVKTIRERDNSADASALVETILGNKKRFTSAAMKHGISLEPEAKRAYSVTMKATHKKYRQVNSGLSIFKDKPFLAASADLETSCECCGKGLCEIKCPESVKDQKPTVDNIPYLDIVNGKVTLSKTHPYGYYHQIQGQMKILNRTFCDLFVYSCHGNLTVRVLFDGQFWNDVEEKLSWFWFSYILPALLTDENQPLPNGAETPVKAHASIHKTKPTACRALMPVANVQVKVQTCKQPRKRQRKSVQNLKKPLVYLCGTCSCDVLDNPPNEDEQSVNCEICDVWVHYKCAGVTNKTIEHVDVWVCAKCK